MAEEREAQQRSEGRHDKPDLRTSDPAVLRALAHPLRVEILAVIDELGEATATQIAEQVGESPSNCSFHLRSLAKAGFIERAEAQGTSKPWRPAHRSRDLRPDPSDPASLRTSATIGALYVQHEAARLVDFFMTRAEEPEWVEGVTVNLSTFWATAEELSELSGDIARLTERFHGREADPATRPSGSRKAHFFGAVNPDPASEPTP
jgi:DNA-binding transcriptional ArsR family regulator